MDTLNSKLVPIVINERVKEPSVIELLDNEEEIVPFEAPVEQIMLKYIHTPEISYQTGNSLINQPRSIFSTQDKQ